VPIGRVQLDFYAVATGWATATVTNAEGKFDLTGLPFGQYRLTVSAPICERYEALVTVEGRTGPLSLQLTRARSAATPVNDSVVSVHELKTSGKAESAFKKGTELLRKGDARGSVIYFERALAKDPGYYRAYHNLGLAQYRLGELALAEDALQRAVDLTNGGFAPSQFALAMILCEKQQFREAETLIHRGLDMEPGSSAGRYLLGLVQLALNRLPDAERSARDALFRNAAHAEAHILLAEIHEREHDPYAVKADVAAYLKLDGHGPLESEASLLLQRAEKEIGQNAGANR
jgi:tetratricopeptide (TPR) repeat protein